jgi:small conductance mechanosensitive channel
MTGLFLFPTSGAEWRTWLSNEGAAIGTIVVVLVIAWIVVRVVALRLLRRVVRRAAEARHQDPDLAERRTETLVSALNWGIGVILVFVGAVIILGKLGLNVSALIASAGIAGLALTLGAQAFVRDLINGTFILAENQYGVGDIVTIAGVTGQVIDLNPRRTVLRDDDGAVHTIPNGTVTVATNLTRDFSRINLLISVTYAEDIQHAIDAIDDECRKFHNEWAGDFLSDLDVDRVEDVTATGANLRVRADVRIFRQWDLTAQLRTRLLRRLASEGIAMPYPKREAVDKGGEAARA